MFLLDDVFHAEQIGEFATRSEALAELARLAAIPWDKAPNAAPCTGWETCGRRYELIEYDNATLPWRELSREHAMEISKAGIRWFLKLPDAK